MTQAKNRYGANDVFACTKCGTGNMIVGRRTPDFRGNPANEVQTLRCSSCGDEIRRIVDGDGKHAPDQPGSRSA